MEQQPQQQPQYRGITRGGSMTNPTPPTRIPTSSFSGGGGTSPQPSPARYSASQRHRGAPHELIQMEFLVGATPPLRSPMGSNISSLDAWGGGGSSGGGCCSGGGEISNIYRACDQRARSAAMIATHSDDAVDADPPTVTPRSNVAGVGSKVPDGSGDGRQLSAGQPIIDSGGGGGSRITATPPTMATSVHRLDTPVTLADGRLPNPCIHVNVDSGDCSSGGSGSGGALLTQSIGVTSGTSVGAWTSAPAPAAAAAPAPAAPAGARPGDNISNVLDAPTDDNDGSSSDDDDGSDGGSRSDGGGIRGRSLIAEHTQLHATLSRVGHRFRLFLVLTLLLTFVETFVGLYDLMAGPGAGCLHPEL